MFEIRRRGDAGIVASGNRQLSPNRRRTPPKGDLRTTDRRRCGWRYQNLSTGNRDGLLCTCLARRAQMRIVTAFLQKGDLPTAAREFSALALNYGDQKEVVSEMSTATRQAASKASTKVSPPQAQSTTNPGGLTEGYA